MSKLVLNSLWDKICDVFVTRTCAAAIEVSKQDPLIAGRGIRIKDNVISNKLIPNDEEDFEEVVVSIISDTANVANKTLNVYYNGSLLPNETYTTDENGTCTFEVPYGYSYEVDFPVISEYLLITPEKHVATLMQRLIEVEYIPLPSIDDDDYGEEVTIHLDKFENNTVTPFEGINVSVKVGTANAVTYTTDENGEITFKVRYGTSYTVTASNLTNYYMNNFSYTKIFIAEKTLRVINFVYHFLRIGMFIVDDQGNEYTLEEFVQARDVDLTVTNEDAILIKVVTSNLAKYDSIFYLGIDDTRKKVTSTGKWADTKIRFNLIPAIVGFANLPNSSHYYRGLEASKLIQLEGDFRGVATAAVDYCLSKLIILQNGNIYKGFLGSTGQWLTIIDNRATINNLLVEVRPESEKPEGVTYYTLDYFYSSYGAWTSCLGGSVTSDRENNAFLFSSLPKSSGGTKNDNNITFSFYSL